MSDIPAFCENCNLFFSSGFNFENSTVSLSGNKAQCPSCHRMASIPDGVFKFINDTIEIIKAPDITFSKLDTYKKLIEKLRAEKASYDEIKSEIEKKAPELNSLGAFLPKTRNELYTFLGLLLAAIGLALNLKNEDKPITNNINITNITNNYNIQYSETKKDTISQEKIIQKKLGRNDRCYCGSNLKFKKCHGKNY